MTLRPSLLLRVVPPCEIGEFEALDGDLVEGLKIDNGHLRVPTGPAWA